MAKKKAPVAAETTKAAKQEAAPAETQVKTASAPKADVENAKDLEVLASGHAVETVVAQEPTPFVQPAPPPAIEPPTAPDPDEAALKAKAVQALQAEVNAIAAGRPLEAVVYRFNKKNGTQAGSSLKYYLACKLNEIENPEQPCDFTSPAGPPAEILQGAKLPAAQKGAKPKCPNCP